MTKKKTILVADDDPAILEAMALMLEDEGYTVKTTINGDKLKDLETNCPDVLLLDIWMSGLNGEEICRKLKNNRKTRHIPVILVSANRDTEKIAKQAGADDFIAKPFEMSELFAKLKKYEAN